MKSIRSLNVGHSHPIDKVISLLTLSKRPVILVGGGVRVSDADPYRLLLKKHKLPVVYSLMEKMPSRKHTITIWGL